MVSGDLKDLLRRAASGKVLSDKAFKITSNPQSNGHQCGFASVV